MRFGQSVFLMAVVGIAAAGLSAPAAGDEQSGAVAGADPGPKMPIFPLPRWREGGTPYDPNQSLTPYAVHLAGPRQAPTSGLVASPPEYEPVRGVLFRFYANQYHQVVSDCVAALTGDPAYDETAYVLVENT